MSIWTGIRRVRTAIREKIIILRVTRLNRKLFARITEEPEAEEGLYLDRQRLGALGEEAAARLYWRDGYQPLFSNYRCPFGEIDLVFEKDGRMALIEVRTRDKDGLLRPAETVGPEKQRKLILTARHLMAQNPSLAELSARFDVVEVFYQGGYSYDINRIENAFDLSAVTNVN